MGQFDFLDNKEIQCRIWSKNNDAKKKIYTDQDSVLRAKMKWKDQLTGELDKIQFSLRSKKLEYQYELFEITYEETIKPHEYIRYLILHIHKDGEEFLSKKTYNFTQKKLFLKPNERFGVLFRVYPSLPNSPIEHNLDEGSPETKDGSIIIGG